jgi:hypothetical protein
MWICIMVTLILQNGHVIDNRFWHLPKLGLVDSNRSLNQCWPLIEKKSGYQPGSKSRYHITYLLVPFPNKYPTRNLPGLGIRTLHIM